MNSIEWKNFRLAITTFVFIASALLCLVIIYTVKSIGFVGTTPTTKTISVSGHGEAFQAPDIATVTYSIEKKAATVVDAQGQVTKISNDMLASLKTLGIEDKDIQTTSYDVYPNYDYTSSACTYNSICPPSRQVLSGYTVSQGVTVKIRAIDKAGDILAALGQKNVSNISGLTFSVEDDTAVTNEARDKAISEAKTQAEILAKQLGVRLVRITSFNENSGGRGGVYYAKDALMSESAANAPAPMIPPGQNKATSDVSITYEIQ